VPAYTTLTVFFDPAVLFRTNALPGKTCFEKLSGYLQQLHGTDDLAAIPQNDTVSIPVCYGGPWGPDLAYVAEYHQLSVDEVIRIHSSAVYKVYMIGFIPGFAYMGGLDQRLETPRKATPRAAVLAGAVGIAGMQTGIYPLQTPGGWQIIGQTSVKLFDAERQIPSLLKAGDRVKFEPSN
jgi:inhibitor of KinA